MKKLLSLALAVVMIFALSITALAATQGDVDVEGHIGIQSDPIIGPDDPTDPLYNTYNVTFSTAVHWWVTEAAPTTVVDGDSIGPGSASNRIENRSSGTTIDVTLDAFTPGVTADNAAVDPFLTLSLTGDLAMTGSPDLVAAGAGYTGPYTYTSSLLYGAGNAWTYGFTGTYSGTLTTAGYAPVYTMTLGFTFQ